MSTVSPGMSARVAEAAEEKGIKYLRAPVSGSTQFAESAALTVLASGPDPATLWNHEGHGKRGIRLFRYKILIAFLLG